MADSKHAGARTPPDCWLGEILDQQLLDRDQRRMGMVDGVMLELREGRPPRVTHLVVGGETLGRRLSRPIGSLVVWFARRFGVLGDQPYRIAWSLVRDVGVDITVDIDARKTPLLEWEERLGRWVRRIPGS